MVLVHLYTLLNLNSLTEENLWEFRRFSLEFRCLCAHCEQAWIDDGWICQILWDRTCEDEQAVLQPLPPDEDDVQTTAGELGDTLAYQYAYDDTTGDIVDAEGHKRVLTAV